MNFKPGSLPRPGLFFFAIITTIFGMVIEARAQVDPNIQSRLNAITIRLDTSQISAPSDSAAALGNGINAYTNLVLDQIELPFDPSNGCTPDHKLYNHLINLYKNALQNYFPKLEIIELKPNKKELKDEQYKREVAFKLRQLLEALNYLKDQGKLDPEKIDPFRKPKATGIPPVFALNPLKIEGKINLCENPQPTTLKVIAPFNPDYETNVLKSNQNIYPDTSVGFGGAFQVITRGAAPYDLVGASVQSASVRYNKFNSTNLDAIITQGVYQHFIGAYSYLQDGSTVPITPPSRDKSPDKSPYEPAQGLTTVDTIALGFLNQTAYTPTFSLETVDLFTPQVTLSRQNISLTGANYVCGAALSYDFRKSGFCYYADLSLTLGQTFSDVPTQQNANVAVSVTLGNRFDQSDWKATLQTIVTERNYDNVVGGRNDVQLQIGPSLIYSPQPFVGSLDGVSMSFTLPVNYYQNYSTISKNSWNGWIVMPTLTLAFQTRSKILD